MESPARAVPRTALMSLVEDEIKNYSYAIVNLGEGVDYSQKELVRRISLFESHTYPTGKFDNQGNYKYWFDIITSRIGNEIKNIDFDTKDINVYSPRKIDELPSIIVNLKIKEYLRETGQAEEINDAIEEGAGWGNVVWKKVKGGYERADMKNFFVVNQTVKCLDETPTIERHQFSSSDLWAMMGRWKYVQETLDGCKSEFFSPTMDTTAKPTSIPYYEIYERNGEVKLSDLKENNGETPVEGDEKKYVLAKVIVAATKQGGNTVNVKYVLYADTLSGKMSDLYKEYHRGRYKGRWFREGIIEILFDLQVRANQIGNQLAQGLEWASKTIFSSSDKLVVQNILTDLKNGDILRTQNLQQVAVRMEGFDQLAAEWNRVLKLADDLTNSQEIVQGEALPAGTAFRLGALLNQNANKLYTFIREKIAIPFTEIFEEWIVPELIKTLKSQEVLRLVGDSDFLDRLYKLIVDDWYLNNLLSFGPHTSEVADTIKATEIDKLKKRPQLLMTGLKKVWEGFVPNVSIIITGENYDLPTKMQTLGDLAAMEADPVRRSAIIAMIAKMDGIDFDSLPKSAPIPQPQSTTPSLPLGGPQAKAQVLRAGPTVQ